MSNKDLAKIFYEMAEILEMKEVAFKPRAFQAAAHSIEDLREDVKEIYKKGGIKALEKIPAVGKGIAERIEEYIKSGHIKDYDKLKKQIPVNISGLSAIEGIGPKLIQRLYKELKIHNVKELEKAAKAGKLRNLPGMGEKLEQKILKGIEFLAQHVGRFPIGQALPLSRNIVEKLKNVKGVKNVESMGSLRRWQESVGDLDFLAVSDRPKEVMEYFVSMPQVEHIYAKGKTKASVRLKSGIDADLRVVIKDSFGAALQYFTGSKDHNVVLRKIASKKGYKLNEYGLFQNKKLKIKNEKQISKIKNNKNSKNWVRVAGKSEEEIYKKLGLDWMPPELRTNSGEIEAAQKHKLPKLIGYSDLKGDLQIQTNWSDGSNSIEEIVEEAKKIGHEYILITDHTKFLAMTGGLDERKLLRQMAYIDKLNSKFQIPNSKFKILKGAEVNILKDGSLDIKDKVLAKLDVVGVGIHSHFNLDKDTQTKRMIRAIENKHVDIIFHPTTRVVLKRPEIKLNLDKIFKAAAKNKTAMEINAHPSRLDLYDKYIRQAKELGVKFSISTDAHSLDDLYFLEYGIGQARRGWLTKKDVINTRSLKEFLKLFK